ncbi:MAG: hypothetical protein R8M45_00485 [Ghiorsea sp.]
MKTTKKIMVQTSTDKVWQVFAHNFDQAHLWMASVPNSFGQENGQLFKGASSAGRVCELDANPKGIKAVESFLAYDEEKKSCTILIKFANTPFAFPLVQNVAEFSLEQRENNQSVVTFTIISTLKPLAYIIYPLIKFGFGFFITQIIEELKYYVEQGKPHPRKVKAANKLARVKNN